MNKNTKLAFNIVIILVFGLCIYYFTKTRVSIVVGDFTEIPEYLWDSGCSFYFNKEDVADKRYAFYSVWGSDGINPEAIMFVNNKTEELVSTPQQDNWSYLNENYRVEINIIKSTQSGIETSFVEGELKIENEYNQSVVHNVIGYCGV